jgi:hypothetical protein
LTNYAIGKWLVSALDEQLDTFELQLDIFVLLTSEI